MGGWRRSYTVVPRHTLINIANHSAHSRSEQVRRQVVGTVVESHHERCDPLPGPGGAHPRYTVAAVARRLGIAPATLRTWSRWYGLGPADHVVRYPPQVRPTRPGPAGVHMPAHAGRDRARRSGPHRGGVGCYGWIFFFVRSPEAIGQLWSVARPGARGPRIAAGLGVMGGFFSLFGRRRRSDSSGRWPAPELGVPA